MDMATLNAKDAEIQAHALRRIKAIKEQRHDARHARALIAEALQERDNARGDMLRKFLKQ